MGARQEEARGGKVSLGKRRPQVFREGPRAEEPGDGRLGGLYVRTRLTGEMECLATWVAKTWVSLHGNLGWEGFGFTVGSL